MGKAYAKELAALGDTYEWARRVPIDPLEEFVEFGGRSVSCHLAHLSPREGT